MSKPVGSGRKPRIFDALNMELAPNDFRRLRQLMSKVIGMAENGDMRAVEFIAERMEGKVAQSVLLGGDDESGPIRQRIEFVVIDPANRGSSQTPPPA